MIEGKRIKFEVEMYWRGKTKKPSVNLLYENKHFEGMPNDIDDAPFFRAAHELCQKLIDAGELD